MVPFSLVMLGRGREPQLPVSRVTTGLNSGYSIRCTVLSASFQILCYEHVYGSLGLSYIIFGRLSVFSAFSTYDIFNL